MEATKGFKQGSKRIWSFKRLTLAAWLVLLVVPRPITFLSLSMRTPQSCWAHRHPEQRSHSQASQSYVWPCVSILAERREVNHWWSVRFQRLATAILEVLKEWENILCHFLLPSGWNVNMTAGERAAYWSHEVWRRRKQQDRRRLGLCRSRSHLASLDLPASRLVLRKRNQYLSH